MTKSGEGQITQIIGAVHRRRVSARIHPRIYEALKLKTWT